MHIRSSWLVTLVFLGTATRMSQAQQIMQRGWDFPAQEQEPPPVAAYGTGIGLGVVGFLTGAATGHALSTGCVGGDGFCNLEAIFYGAAVGGTLGMALGVHMGNGRRGNFGLDFVTGAAIWGAGIGIVTASKWDDPVAFGAFVLIPIAQLITTVAVERTTGRTRSRNQRVGFFISPRLDRGAAIVGRFVF